MKVSINTIKQYTNVDLSVEDLVSKINQQLGGVEEIINLGVRYEGAVIAKIMSCDDHPNADRLHVCKIDDGGVTENVERDENGYVQVVCGAPNAREGIYVVWLPPKSTVPSSYDETELFVLEARELRGVVSNGMLASVRELALGDEHDGILEIDADEWKPSGEEVKPGASFAKVYGLDDTIIDIENKMFTHRPDCFGQLGVAREIAGIQHNLFSSPDWYKTAPIFEEASGLDLQVFNDASSAVPRFLAIAINNVTVKQSPLWLRAELVRLGSKSINNIVDITNYIMLLTGQPLHAYDYDKLRGHKLGARMAKKGERASLLNGKEYELDSSDIVIVDDEGVVGLGGVMGGGNSEVSETTQAIVLECATFDMYTIRKTSMRHGIFTDAVTRFNKGQSPRQNAHVLSLAMKSIFDVAGGTQASGLFDENPEVTSSQQVDVTPRFINERLGLNLSADEISSLLKNVEFEVEGDEKLRITAPYWRTDIELPEDIVEEVGRLYGFDKLPRVLPKQSILPAAKNSAIELSKRIRGALSRAGANEVLTYSFVHENVLTRANQDASKAFRLGNALSPDLQYYRLSVTPSLLDKIHANVKAGYNEFALFEIGKAHSKSSISETDGLPAELKRVALTYVAKQEKQGAAYYQAKQLLEYLGKTLGLEFAYKELPADTSLVFARPFEPRRSARITDIRSGQTIGIVGEYKKQVVKNFKLPTYSAGFEILPEAIALALEHTSFSYTPLSRYPSIERDICFKVDKTVSYSAITDAVHAILNDSQLETSVSPVDIYADEAKPTKNITIRIKLTSHEATLTSEDANAVVERVADQVVSTLHAEVI